MVTMETAPLYERIDAGQIRLLHLHPRVSLPSQELPLPSEEVIECDLVAVNRADNPMYEALSYEWGPKNQDGAVFPVRVNGQLLNVRENLWWALFYLRGNEPRPLWADAVCINQEDLIEKSNQVQNMGDLFSHAWNTIIWLGKEHEDVGDDYASEAETCEFIQRVYDYYPHGNATRPFPDWLLAKRSWNGVNALCDRSYWRRYWIIQEFCMAKSRYIQCGPWSIPWDKILNLSKLYMRLDGTALAPLWLVDSGWIFVANTSVSTVPWVDMFHLMCWYLNSQCEDSRDRIFAIRTLFKPCCQSAAPVDYSSSSTVVFKRSLKHSITTHQDHAVSHIYNAAANQFGLAIRSQRLNNIWEFCFAKRLLCPKIIVYYIFIHLSALDRKILATNHRSVTNRYWHKTWMFDSAGKSNASISPDYRVRLRSRYNEVEVVQ